LNFVFILPAEISLKLNFARLEKTFTKFSAYQFGKRVQTALTGYAEINMQSYTVESSSSDT